MLRLLLAGTATAQGADVLPVLLQHLCTALGVGYALVGEVRDGAAATALVLRTPDGEQRDVAWPLQDTPCQDVLAGAAVHVADGLGAAYPRSPAVRRQALASYHGEPLRDDDGQVLGHLCVFDAGPRRLDPAALDLFRLFAARARLELVRRRLVRTLGENEERLRDLFDEAPIAYVHEDLESRFLRANKTALRVLGVKPEEVPTTVGISLAPDTPDAQRRIKEAFESIGRGADTSGVVLELRRKDNGKPVWIQWWSRPDPSGTYTRTMFLDITERMLLEQEQTRLREQNAYLREELKSVHDFEAIVGRSKPLLDVLAQVQRVARTDTSVLVTGETGTGKELIARAIHSTSARRDKPLIKLNCAALPTSLVESELFGHERGAFSGAVARRLGRFELAHGGTIFLDEIGELPLEVQAKLLRVLQEHEFERVGGSQTLPCDVRVIAATNRDLDKAIRDGRFRADLFYRLNVFPLHLPPLRERIDDLPLLAAFFLQRFSARVGRRIDGISEALQERLRGYRWPGNIRELENLLERAVILADGPVLDVDAVPHLAAAAGVASAPGPAPPQRLLEVERQHVLAVLEGTGWVVEGPAGAAKVLGLHPNTLRSRLRRLGIKRPG